MSGYIEISFNGLTSVQSEILVAELGSAGFEGFEEEDNSLKAYRTADGFDESVIKEIASRQGIDFSQAFIGETNWNQIWESNFHPVIIEDFAGIRADFHTPLTGVQHEIVITPKMSFGTGHHATTWMMIRQMKDIVFTGRSVLDFGTGTGILAILAEQLGAATITAIDHDDWSIENAKENIVRNSATKILLKKAGSAELGQDFDIILANINKNVILDNLGILAKQLKPSGVLLLSGLLPPDEQDIVSQAGREKLVFSNRLEKHNWLSIRLSA